MTIARSSGELKKLLASYKKVDLLILDEWLIRPLTPQESYILRNTLDNKKTVRTKRILEKNKH